MAARKDDAADPVGRGRGLLVGVAVGLAVGVPLPCRRKPPPDGSVTPCSSRHWRNAENCDELVPEDPVEPGLGVAAEPAPHPATASEAVSAAVASRTGRMRPCHCLP